MSCATAGGLTYLFADINTSRAASEAIAALPTALPLTAASSAPAPAATAATDGTVASTPLSPSPSPSPSASTSTSPATSNTAAPPAAVQAYNGELVNTRYGPVQVQVQFTGGAINEVAVVVYPDGEDKSVRINARALPTLRAEVLTAQTGHVDTVSGATYTSEAYMRSLQSAIDQARTAGITTIR